MYIYDIPSGKQNTKWSFIFVIFFWHLDLMCMCPYQVCLLFKQNTPIYVPVYYQQPSPRRLCSFQLFPAPLVWFVQVSLDVQRQRRVARQCETYFVFIWKLYRVIIITWWCLMLINHQLVICSSVVSFVQFLWPLYPNYSCPFYEEINWLCSFVSSSSSFTLRSWLNTKRRMFKS